MITVSFKRRIHNPKDPFVPSEGYHYKTIKVDLESEIKSILPEPDYRDPLTLYDEVLLHESRGYTLLTDEMLKDQVISIAPEGKCTILLVKYYHHPLNSMPTHFLDLLRSLVQTKVRSNLFIAWACYVFDPKESLRQQLPRYREIDPDLPLTLVLIDPAFDNVREPQINDLLGLEKSTLFGKDKIRIRKYTTPCRFTYEGRCYRDQLHVEKIAKLIQEEGDEKFKKKLISYNNRLPNNITVYTVSWYVNTAFNKEVARFDDMDISILASNPNLVNITIASFDKETEISKEKLMRIADIPKQARAAGARDEEEEEEEEEVREESRLEWGTSYDEDDEEDENDEEDEEELYW